MHDEIFNTTFENMLRILLLVNTVGQPVNSDRIVALDFISIYGKKFKVLDKNLHGDNEFGFSEFARKREKISEAIRLGVRNDFLSVEGTEDGFLYEITDRGKIVVEGIQSSYARSYCVGAKIVIRRFSNFSDESLLRYINDRSDVMKEV